jgi:hypothetical protein
MSGKSYTVTKIGDELANALALRAALREEADVQLMLDMIEGSTNLHEAVCVVAEEILEDEILLEGTKAMATALAERRSRIEKSIETRRGIILMAMDRASVPTIKSPTCTLSVRDIPPKVVVVNEAEIPATYFVAAEPKLDKRALGEALKSGAVPGAELSNGGVGLTLRRA